MDIQRPSLNYAQNIILDKHSSQFCRSQENTKMYITEQEI